MLGVHLVPPLQANPVSTPVQSWLQPPVYVSPSSQNSSPALKPSPHWVTQMSSDNEVSLEQYQPDWTLHSVVQPGLNVSPGSHSSSPSIMPSSHLV